MNTIVLGFKDASGKGPAVMLAGPEVPGNDQVGMLTKIKQGGRAPEGIARLEMFVISTRMAALVADNPAVKHFVTPKATEPAANPKLKIK